MLKRPDKLPLDSFGWPDPSRLQPQMAAFILSQLQGALWGNEDGTPNPDREWDSNTIETVAAVLEAAGLRPPEKTGG